MRVFISEFVCGGGWPDPKIGGSLAREGEAMLRAVALDFARIPGVRATTTWDARLGAPPFENVHVVVIESPGDELPVFRELAQLSDATLVIAPETHGHLTQRCRIVEGAGGNLLGSASRAVEVCTDKLALSKVLDSAGVPNVPTESFVSNRPNGARGAEECGTSADARPTFPLVVKPRDGAGSQSTYLVRDRAQLLELGPALAADRLLEFALRQPYIAGKAVSVAVLISHDGQRLEPFPPAAQTLSNDGRFRYLGGVIPARNVDLPAIQRVARDACRAVEGLRGYVGVDLIVPDEAPERPVVVEINPRLTTSYIGYRRLTDANLAERMLRVDCAEPIAWRGGCVTFDADGAVR
jgi:hypothetical protein